MGACRTFGLPIRHFAAGSQISSIQKSQIPKINRRGGLLLLLRMKCRFLGLQICDQGLNPFNRDLIAIDKSIRRQCSIFLSSSAQVSHMGNPFNRVPRQRLLDAYW